MCFEIDVSRFHHLQHFRISRANGDALQSRRLATKQDEWSWLTSRMSWVSSVRRPPSDSPHGLFAFAWNVNLFLAATAFYIVLHESVEVSAQGSMLSLDGVALDTPVFGLRMIYAKDYRLTPRLARRPSMHCPGRSSHCFCKIMFRGCRACQYRSCPGS